MCRLTPIDICMIADTARDKSIEIAAEQAGYGIASGASYVPGSNRLVAPDRNAGVMVHWNHFLVRVQTTFLGRIPTAEHVYGLEATVTFAIESPALVYRCLLQAANRLALETFSQGVAERVQRIAGRLASRYSPDALVGGPAMFRGQQELQEELARIYAPDGLTVSSVLLTDVSALIRDHALDLLKKKIEADARQQELAIDESFRQNREAVDEAAQAGDSQAKTLATQLAGVHSFAELERQVSQPTPQVAVANRAPEVSLAAEPVLMSDKHGSHARFAVLSPRHPPRYYEACREWFFVGRDENCHICLPTTSVSALHATVARIGSGLAVVDHDSTNGSHFNGERIAQRFIDTGDVLRIGDYWIVFKLEPGQEFQQIDHDLRGVIASSGRTVPAVDDVGDLVKGIAPASPQGAIVRLFSSAGRSATSDSRPILIGSDSTCELRLAGGGVARFHAVVYWGGAADRTNVAGEVGVFIEDLHSGRGIMLNGQAAKQAKLADGDTLEIADHRVTVSMFGNVAGRAAALRAAYPARGNLAVTCIEGPAAGASIRLDPQVGRVVIGRADECDFVLRCPKVSSRHAEVVTQLVAQGDGSYRPEFSLRDLGSTNGTLLNGRPLQPQQPHTLRPGDIIRLVKDGDHCDLLVHQTA